MKTMRLSELFPNLETRNPASVALQAENITTAIVRALFDQLLPDILMLDSREKELLPSWSNVECLNPEAGFIKTQDENDGSMTTDEKLFVAFYSWSRKEHKSII